MSENVLKELMGAFEAVVSDRNNNLMSRPQWKFSPANKSVQNTVENTISAHTRIGRDIVFKYRQQSDIQKMFLEDLEEATLTIAVPRIGQKSLCLEALFSISAGIPCILEEDLGVAKLLVELCSSSKIFIIKEDMLMGGSPQTRLEAWKSKLNDFVTDPETFMKTCSDVRKAILMDEKTAKYRYTFLQVLCGNFIKYSPTHPI